MPKPRSDRHRVRTGAEFGAGAYPEAIDNVFVSEPSSTLGCTTPQRVVLTGLGRVERAIVTYLATAPGRGEAWGRSTDAPMFPGFGLAWRRGSGGQSEAVHGNPAGVHTREIAQVIYGTDAATPAQMRAVQRAVRHLETLGLVDVCQGARTGERTRTTPYGVRTELPIPCLWVALRWRCEHLANEREERS